VSDATWHPDRAGIARLSTPRFPVRGVAEVRAEPQKRTRKRSSSYRSRPRRRANASTSNLP
jgi:hypothetical protein